MCPICGEALLPSPADHLIEKHSFREKETPLQFRWLLLETYSNGLSVKAGTGRATWNGRKGDLYESVCFECVCGVRFSVGHLDAAGIINDINYHIAMQGGLEAHYAATAESLARRIMGMP